MNQMQFLTRSVDPCHGSWCRLQASSNRRAEPTAPTPSQWRRCGKFTGSCTLWLQICPSANQQSDGIPAPDLLILVHPLRIIVRLHSTQSGISEMVISTAVNVQHDTCKYSTHQDVPSRTMQQQFPSGACLSRRQCAWSPRPFGVGHVLVPWQQLAGVTEGSFPTFVSMPRSAGYPNCWDTVAANEYRMAPWLAIGERHVPDICVSRHVRGDSPPSLEGAVRRATIPLPGKGEDLLLRRQ
ncbi:hypothetical protein AUEXF2481DRAFT_456036 [Aureobasidium subglaciale EXF-2481]|uniref:Uncharacterized protein n=1 Tax=Aureobasidium subglaciale (strain EXF-2481) TaxID=1043005 RepID=A0A074Y1R8_AURSE|nr:uncharacterized protein AUEXF2481DRAFT_456036 [Aureobasidium subglaciale EXF-2481]KEQ91650.1 hypothetical protein AUEXF2481DRAFT_456036 [Aureobasidium subglaciale EXF-2481]